MDIRYENETFGIRLSEKLVSMSFEVISGQKSKKRNRISIFLKRRKIILKHLALELGSEKTDSRDK